MLLVGSWLGPALWELSFRLSKGLRLSVEPVVVDIHNILVFRDFQTFLEKNLYVSYQEKWALNPTVGRSKRVPVQ